MGRATLQFCRLPLYPVLSNLYSIDRGFRSPQPVEYLVQATVPELFPAEGVGGNACASRLERKPPPIGRFKACPFFPVKFGILGLNFASKTAANASAR